MNYAKQLRAHETKANLVCRLLLEKKNINLHLLNEHLETHLFHFILHNFQYNYFYHYELFYFTHPGL